MAGVDNNVQAAAYQLPVSLSSPEMDARNLIAKRGKCRFRESGDACMESGERMADLTAFETRGTNWRAYIHDTGESLDAIQHEMARELEKRNITETMIDGTGSPWS